MTLSYSVILRAFLSGKGGGAGTRMPSPRFVPGDWVAASARVVGWFVGTTKVMPFSHSRRPSSSVLFLLHLIPSPLPAVSSSPSLFPLSDGKEGGKGTVDVPP